jgi:hypothetical protein
MLVGVMAHNGTPWPATGFTVIGELVFWFLSKLPFPVRQPCSFDSIGTVKQ